MVRASRVGSMPITGISWSGNTGRDIHVLRNNITTRALNHQALVFSQANAPDVFADQYAGGDVTLTFTPLFKGAPGPNNTFVGDNNGLTVNTQTGAVTVAAGVPPNVKNNFIIEVSALNAGANSPFTETIRVQVHSSVTQVWLTPDQLVVRPIGALPEASNYRFAVRAQFDDDVIGDLTDNHNVTWSDPGGHMQNDGTIQILAGDNPGDNFFVTATLPPELGGAATPAGPTVQVGTSWANAASPPTLTIVAGGGLPAAGTVESSPNVLMLGDGFRAGDEDSFNQIVDTLVHHAKTSALTKPYNLLSSRINFWRTFVPASDVGISFRSEMYFSADDTGASAIPAVQKPPADAQFWTLGQLLYVVGLPIPAEGPDGSLNLSPEDFQNRWRPLLQNDPWPHIQPVTQHDGTVTYDVVERWQNLAKRAFIEEIDGFPAMAFGEPPAADLADTTMLTLHEDRAGVAGLIPFYTVLASPSATLADGTAIGRVWAEDVFPFHNRTLVVAISSFPGGRALNAHVTLQNALFGYIAISTKAGNPAVPVQKIAGRNTYSLNIAAVPTDVNIDRARTVTHELGHSFGLGDEYADFNRPFPRPHTSPLHANLQTEADTQIPDPNDPTKNILSGDQIPWVWHRILAAAVVNGNITAEGVDTFRIPVAPDVSFRFVNGDQLLLRPRTWGTALRKFGPLDISGALILTEDPQPDSVLVRATGAISAQTFPSGSLLFKPKPAPPQLLTAAYPYAEMVAKNIKDAITTNRAPLTELPCAMEGTGSGIQLPVLDISEGRTAVAGVSQDPFLDMIKIVGLYANGAQYACGIFHPTGHCMMRNSHEDQAEFCAVCRYIMVDMIAPEFHSDIDADYEVIYAETLGTLNG